MKRSFRDTLLITINYLVAVIMLLAACLIDSDSWVPFIIFAICALWLVLFAIVRYIGGNK